MAVPVRQSVKVGAYIARQRLARREKYALVLELEPLYQCNLACAGCGKIQHPDHILRRRMPVQDAVAAVEECGAPVVSIAGGEPLIHPEIHTIVAELVARKRFVYLCTNALLMEKKMKQFEPSPYFAWAVHMDGMQERHDKSVCRDGVFDKAVDAINEAKRRGFRVTTNTTFFSDDTPQTVREVLDFLNDELEVDQMMISPAYAYEKAPDQEHFPGVEQTRRLFKAAFADGRRRRWRLNHSPLFLDFLEGRTDFQCTAWGIPSYSIFGWQRPCYLMSDGYASSYRELLEETEWEKYGRGRDPRCDNCMAHCGYEPTAVNEAVRAPHKALLSTVRGLRS
jgi:hopanoid biosynthesis associated radical SAM protein HpnH